MQNFTLKNKKKSKKKPNAQALKTHLQKHFEVSFPWKLEGT
ncbi:hypothetical protein GCM10010129_84490 [Streptomyces fumigatiscleroticus]|nr:hypothetical protein GCM10010129_84490 [Streptomyces fumigatiscleroticus]